MLRVVCVCCLYVDCMCCYCLMCVVVRVCDLSCYFGCVVVVYLGC